MLKILRAYWPILAFLAVCMLVASLFMAPAAPKKLAFAAGAPNGAYSLTAEKYAAVFEEKGYSLEIQSSTGSGDNLEKLRSGEVGAAIIQGGVSTEADAEELQSLGAIFFEPLWVFYRADLAPEGTNASDIRTLEGLRVAAGSKTSGTRALANELFLQNDVEASLVDMGGAEGAAALKAGKIDVLVSVSAPSAPFVRDMLADPGVRVLNFKRALAYERRTPYLKRVIFPEGGLDLANNLPSSSIELVAPAAEVVVRHDLHPDLQILLLEAMTRTHRGGTLLSESGAFPNMNRNDLPISEEAERYYEQGPSFMRRIFPFSVANFLDRAWVLAIPLITLAYPLAKAAPPVYRWRTRRKIYVWYKDLRRLEQKGRAAKTPEARDNIRRELSALQAEVGRVEVPESYTDELYRLRSHVLFVHQLIGNLDTAEKQPPDFRTIS